MPGWICLSLLVSLFLLPGPGLAASDRDRALRDMPPQHQDAYRAQLVQLGRVARRLLQAVPDPPQVNFILAAGDHSINAGATFGKILLTEGMLRFVRSDDELAMILGHELAHLTEGHVSRGAVNNTLLSLGSLLVGTIYPGVGLAAGQIGQLFLNRFNQDQERAADRVGLRYASDAGYDPRAGAQVMRRMAEEVPQTATVGFFSSHPSSAERATTLQRMAEQLSGPSATRVVADGSSRGWSRIERDEAACRKARPYFYRALDATNMRKKVSLYQRGLRICPQSPRAHFELADAYVRQGNLRDAAAEFQEVLRYDPDYPDARRRLREVERRVSRVPP